MKFGISIATVLLISLAIYSQSTPEALKGTDRDTYADLMAQRKPVLVADDEKATENNRRVLKLKAMYIVGRLLDPKHVAADDFSRLIQEAIREDLPIRNNRKINDGYIEFGREMGNALVQELEPALKSPKPVVRINSARLLSIVASMGCAKSAELALKVLEDPQENDAVKFWCLRTLTEAFEFVPDAAVPELSIFQLKDRNNKDERELERKCIVFLCNYITTPRDVNNKIDEEQNAMRYVRREAIRALGHVRTHRLKFQGQVLAHPGLVLLKVANEDGLVPTPGPKERAEAITGFCRLFPVVRSNVDRDIQCDYAAAMLGNAILELVKERLRRQDGKIMIPWIETAAQWENGLNIWSRNANDLKLSGADTATKLYNQAKGQILDALRANQQANQPNEENFGTWLKDNPPKTTNLYQDEPGSSSVKPTVRN